MKKYHFIVFLSLLLFSCVGHDISSAYGDSDTINIDKATKEAKILFSSIVDAPKVIVLETKEDCLIQNVRSLELFNNKIYILDDKANKLYVFDMDGKFITCISSAGKGHGEYLELADFSIDRKNNVILLFDEANDIILKYDLNTGKFLSDIKTERNGYRSYSMQLLNDKVYLNRTSIDNKEMFELREIDVKTGKQTNSYLKSSEYNNGWNCPLRLPFSNFYSKNSDCPKYVGMYSNKIVGITKDGVLPIYTIVSKDFADRRHVEALEKKFVENNFMLDFEEISKSNKIYQISRVTEIPDYLIFQYMHGLDRMYLLHNRSKGKTFISPLLVNDFVADDNYIPMDICYSDENGVLSILQSDYISYFIQQFIKEEKIKKDIDNYGKLIKITENSNPMLFYHKIKK